MDGLLTVGDVGAEMAVSPGTPKKQKAMTPSKATPKGRGGKKEVPKLKAKPEPVEDSIDFCLDDEFGVKEEKEEEEPLDSSYF